MKNFFDDHLIAISFVIMFLLALLFVYSTYQVVNEITNAGGLGAIIGKEVRNFNKEANK